MMRKGHVLTLFAVAETELLGINQLLEKAEILVGIHVKALNQFLVLYNIYREFMTTSLLADLASSLAF